MRCTHLDEFTFSPYDEARIIIEITFIAYDKPSISAIYNSYSTIYNS